MGFHQFEGWNLKLGLDAAIQSAGFEDLHYHEGGDGIRTGSVTRQLRKKAIPRIFELGGELMVVVGHPLEFVEHDRPWVLLERFEKTGATCPEGLAEAARSCGSGAGRAPRLSGGAASTRSDPGAVIQISGLWRPWTGVIGRICHYFRPIAAARQA